MIVSNPVTLRGFYLCRCKHLVHLKNIYIYSNCLERDCLERAFIQMLRERLNLKNWCQISGFQTSQSHRTLSYHYFCHKTPTPVLKTEAESRSQGRQRRRIASQPIPPLPPSLCKTPEDLSWNLRVPCNRLKTTVLDFYSGHCIPHRGNKCSYVLTLSSYDPGS